MGETVQPRRRHLCVAEDAAPLAEAQIGLDDDAGVLVEFGQQVKQQRTTGLAEREVAEFVQDEPVHIHQPVRQLPGSALILLVLQCVDQLGREPPRGGSGMPIEDRQRV